ncbi:MAG TPA: ornithine cyclodeaminase family protein [Candidatus Aminicenantes bacterium]|nr:ornithine cyclodeaminase family protein [Candidatus Aminicenantes bacterium]HRY66182.1 ornithine cyclodeaminase family protein [Candidatus Aminicenantes bacterium]HRZ73096.1 ornithine cyclodeaminase family protein [Candidatus Aminicenantes bacterium]
MNGTPKTLLLTRADLEPLMDPSRLIDAVEKAFRARSAGGSFGNAMIHGTTPGALEFHVKAGGLVWDDRLYYGLKANGSCFGNRESRGLPNILGAILLFDGESGYPLAILESTVLTRHRTAAGTAAALRRLAPAGAGTAAILGCGSQGRTHARYLREVLPLAEIWAYDADPSAARAFAAAAAGDLSLPVHVAERPAEAASRSRVIVTCTPSRVPLLAKGDIRPGTTVAAVGADSPDKQELEARVLAGAKVVVDILDQCAAAGELHHAIAEGMMSRTDVHAEIGDIIAGLKPGRESDAETIVYDATGTALQDAAGAIVAYEEARRRGVGRALELFA